MKFDYKQIGRKIQYYRKEADLTQAELGLKINRSESSITKYENGLTEIPLKVMELIAGNLNTTVEELFSTKLGDGQNVEAIGRIHL